MSTSVNALAWKVADGEAVLAETLGPSGTLPQALVQVRYTGVCGSDVPKLSRTWNGPIPTPWFPGHEIVGREAGSGKWVAVDPLIGCATCHDCRNGRIHLCPALRRIGWDLPGGLAEAVRVPPASVVELPSLQDPAHGTLADPLAVALHGVRCGLPAPCGRIGIVGAGPLGICTAVAAAAAGWEVHLAVRSAARHRELHAALAGRNLSVHNGALPLCEAVVDAASGQNDSPLRQAIEGVRDGGMVLVQNAYLPGVALSTPLRDLFRRSITVRGSFSYCRAGGRDDFRDALALLEHGGAWADLLTRDRYLLPELPQALAALQGPSPSRPIKVLLTPNS
ncbi:zinc-binding dehydrogenase [Streptomyces sp. NPDC087297]|uniref:zinc-dependent alcohol dehydrogenase n=1 Tax=Streptomyces sp. NPDC087297 TaxID=3365778 RepID=UPI0038252C85